MTDLDTLAGAEKAQAKATDALREASEASDRLAGDQWARRQAKREQWARSVIATSSQEESRLAAEDIAAGRVFQAACANVKADPRIAYLAWIDARIARNVNRDRTTAARAILGQDQGDSGYPITDTPNYADSISRALASEVTARMGEASGVLTTEINALDR